MYPEYVYRQRMAVDGAICDAAVDDARETPLGSPYRHASYRFHTGDNGLEIPDALKAEIIVYIASIRQRSFYVY